MRDEYLVSVIIPTYKSNETLIKSIDSILTQTYKNIEVIVVDDNKRDSIYRKKTVELMKQYENNKKVKYIKHTENKNGSAARNTGFKNSNGQYICLLDDDDYFYDTKVEQQVKFLQNNDDYGGVYCDFIRGGKVHELFWKLDFSEEILLLKLTPHTSTIMIKSDVYEKLNGFDESYFRHQDYEFLLRFFDSYKIGKVDQVLVEVSSNGVDNRVNGKILEGIKDKFLAEFEYKMNKLNPKFRKNVYAQNYSAVFWNYIKLKEYSNAWKVFEKYFCEYNIIFLKYLLKYLIFIIKSKSIKLFRLGKCI